MLKRIRDLGRTEILEFLKTDLKGKGSHTRNRIYIYICLHNRYMNIILKEI